MHHRANIWRPAAHRQAARTGGSTADQTTGVDRLRAWGLLDELVATTPVILDRTYWLDDEPHAAHPPADGRHALAPRRTVLDPLLLDAA